MRSWLFVMARMFSRMTSLSGNISDVQSSFDVHPSSTHGLPRIVVLGQAALFAAPWLAVYGLALWAGFHIFVLAYEEPTLRRIFPEDYAAFTAAVPRWRPRLKPWTPG